MWIICGMTVVGLVYAAWSVKKRIIKLLILLLFLFQVIESSAVFAQQDSGSSLIHTPLSVAFGILDGAIISEKEKFRKPISEIDLLQVKAFRKFVNLDDKWLVENKSNLQRYSQVQIDATKQLKESSVLNSNSIERAGESDNPMTRPKDF